MTTKDNLTFYFEKSIAKDKIYKSAEDSKFLIEYDIDIATTHPDDQGDRIEKGFLESITSDLQKNRAHFYNHEIKKKPVGKVLKAQTIALADGHYATRLRIGISKTAPDIATLIEEGILTKGSIGGEITDLDFNESEGLYVLKAGTCRESSTVNIPANSMTGVGSIYKSLRKSVGDARKVNTKDIEEEEAMATNEELQKMLNDSVSKAIDGVSTKFEKKFDEVDAEKLALEKSLAEQTSAKDELKKQYELSQAKAEEKEKEAEELKKQLGSRQSGRQEIDDKNDQLYTDDKYAMAKGLYDFGKFLLDAQVDDQIILEGSLGTEGMNLKRD